MLNFAGQLQLFAVKLLMPAVKLPILVNEDR